MSLKKTLAKILIFAVLQLGAMTGAAMTPEEIEKIAKLTARTEVHHVLKQDDPP